MTEHLDQNTHHRQSSPVSLSGTVPNVAKAARLFVNEPGYDDVGRVLRRMGKEFAFKSATKIEQSKPANTVLFLNCGGPSVYSARRLRRFVEDGGTVYASDQQATFVARAFPEVFRVSKPMDFGSFSAMVVDRGLKEALGGTLRLHFDVGDWRFLIPKRSQRVKVYVSIQGSELGLMARRSSAEGIPIVLGYDVPGGGSVFFTAFHGAAQQSRKIKELIRFLILRPIMSGDLRTTRLMIPNVARTDGVELFGVLSSSAPLRDYVIQEAGTWRVSLSWQGTAKLRLEL
ncbi:MAG TPA: hypothetical protein PK869_06880, partial [Candidatus Hydrogenedentes bacterium]|nr:hypothetical protein [Candidatus Hydrogenedentota bacterium]